MPKNKNTITFIKAVEESYKAKEKEYMTALNEMLVSTNELEESGEFETALKAAVATTLDSVFKLYVTIYGIKPTKEKTNA
jgi:alkaline phosphatase